MWRSLGPKLGCVGLALLLGCGKTRQEGSPSGPAGTGAAAETGGTAGGPSDLPVGASGGEAGAPATPEPGYGASLFDPIPIPAAPPGSLDGTERVEQQTLPVWVSEDGSLIIGDSFTTYTRSDGTRAHQDSQGFVWTERSGVQPLHLPLEADLLNACVAADGSSALLAAFPVPPSSAGGVYRWTEQGLEELSLPAGAERLSIEGCDAALTRAAFRGGTDGYFWTTGGAVQRMLAPEGSTVENALVSRLGSLAVVNTVSRSVSTPYRFDFTQGSLSALGANEKDNCVAVALSDDGTKVTGACMSEERSGFYSNEVGVSRMERLTPLQLSADGDVAWVTRDEQGPARAFGTWTTDLGVFFPFHLGSATWQLVGSVADGTVAFVNVGFPPALEAKRCSIPEGVTSLPLLPGHDRAQLNAVSRDGEVQVGELAAAGSGVGVPVLWDSKGARDVLAELKRARVDLPSGARLKLSRVWHDAEQVRILGTAVVGDAPSSVGILIRLPTR